MRELFAKLDAHKEETHSWIMTYEGKTSLFQSVVRLPTVLCFWTNRYSAETKQCKSFTALFNAASKRTNHSGDDCVSQCVSLGKYHNLLGPRIQILCRAVMGMLKLNLHLLKLSEVEEAGDYKDSCGWFALLSDLVTCGFVAVSTTTFSITWSLQISF